MKFNELENKEYKVVLRIEWIDASGDINPSWVYVQDIKDNDLLPVKCVNWGLLINWNKDYIILCSAINDSEQLSSRFIIPKNCIINIVKIDSYDIEVNKNNE